MGRGATPLGWAAITNERRIKKEMKERRRGWQKKQSKKKKYEAKKQTVTTNDALSKSCQSCQSCQTKFSSRARWLIFSTIPGFLLFSKLVSSKINNKKHNRRNERNQRVAAGRHLWSQNNAEGSLLVLSSAPIISARKLINRKKQQGDRLTQEQTTGQEKQKGGEVTCLFAMGVVARSEY